jgi:hypothetical protein
LPDARNRKSDFPGGPHTVCEEVKAEQSMAASSMRVLVAHTFYRLPGGEDRYVEQLVDLLGRHHDVELLRRSNRDLSGNTEAVRTCRLS